MSSIDRFAQARAMRGLFALLNGVPESNASPSRASPHFDAAQRIQLGPVYLVRSFRFQFAVWQFRYKFRFHE